MKLFNDVAPAVGDFLGALDNTDQDFFESLRMQGTEDTITEAADMIATEIARKKAEQEAAGGEFTSEETAGAPDELDEGVAAYAFQGNNAMSRMGNSGYQPQGLAQNPYGSPQF